MKQNKNKQTMMFWSQIVCGGKITSNSPISHNSIILLHHNVIADIHKNAPVEESSPSGNSSCCCHYVFKAF